jgi:hypothetical protein
MARWVWTHLVLRLRTDDGTGARALAKSERYLQRVQLRSAYGSQSDQQIRLNPKSQTHRCEPRRYPEQLG